MGLTFQFSTASEIIFGIGAFSKVSEILRPLGSRIMVVTGKRGDRLIDFREEFFDFEWVEVFAVMGEPTVSRIEEGIALARQMNCDAVLGVGGGSALDAAKAIAAMVPQEGRLIDYLEVIGKGKKLIRRPLPVVAVPTTAGTGSEVTKNAVIKSEEHHVKVSLRSNQMYPSVALIDPELTLSMPPELTAVTGFDAFTHLLESFVSGQSNSFVDQFCREGLRLIASSLENAFLNGRDLKAREDMSLASLMGGMALANAKLGAIHGFAGPLGGMLDAPHGAVCASLTPAVMRVNISELRKNRDRGHLARYEEVARILTGSPDVSAEDGISWVEGLSTLFNIPSLGELGLHHSDFDTLVEKARLSSSMKGNPVELNPHVLMSVLEQSA